MKVVISLWVGGPICTAALRFTTTASASASVGLSGPQGCPERAVCAGDYGERKPLAFICLWCAERGPLGGPRINHAPPRGGAPERAHDWCAGRRRGRAADQHDGSGGNLTFPERRCRQRFMQRIRLRRLQAGNGVLCEPVLERKRFAKNANSKAPLQPCARRSAKSFLPTRERVRQIEGMRASARIPGSANAAEPIEWIGTVRTLHGGGHAGAKRSKSRITPKPFAEPGVAGHAEVTRH